MKFGDCPRFDGREENRARPYAFEPDRLAGAAAVPAGIREVRLDALPELGKPHNRADSRDRHAFRGMPRRTALPVREALLQTDRMAREAAGEREAPSLRIEVRREAVACNRVRPGFAGGCLHEGEQP